MKLMKINYNLLIDFVISKQLIKWETKKNKPFKYQIYENRFEVLNSKGGIKKIYFNHIELFCDAFNKNPSAKINSYSDISHDASYLLAFINAYMEGILFDSMPSYFSKLNNNQKYLSRSKIYQLLGANLRNDRWAWGGVSDDESFVIFTIWTDRIQSDNKLELYNPSFEKNRNGAKEQKRLIEIALMKNLNVYGLICDAKDPTLDTRSINRVEQNDLVQMVLIKDGENFWVQLKERFPISELRNKHKFKNLAVDDLDQDDIGNDSPNKAKFEAAYYVRDPKVRKAVIQMAQGKCEYCGQEGFLKSDGTRYLEAHHIIALSNEGKDKVTNVIALCPNHHKEAHYGENSEQLEIKFIEIVKQR